MNTKIFLLGLTNSPPPPFLRFFLVILDDDGGDFRDELDAESGMIFLSDGTKNINNGFIFSVKKSIKARIVAPVRSDWLLKNKMLTAF